MKKKDVRKMILGILNIDQGDPWCWRTCEKHYLDNGDTLYKFRDEEAYYELEISLWEHSEGGFSAKSCFLVSTDGPDLPFNDKIYKGDDAYEVLQRCLSILINSLHPVHSSTRAALNLLGQLNNGR